MRVFVTGASGFVGLAVVRELVQAGHQVLGMARSDAGAKVIADAGAQVHRGDLKNLESLRAGVALSDGVIHTAFIHDFSNFAESCAVDRVAIETLGSALVGSDRPLIVTSGTGLLSPGKRADESVEPAYQPAWPRVSEQTTAAVAAKGVSTSVVRLPPTVHGDGDHAFIPMLINVAREKGVSAYVGHGLNRWPAVHRLDAAHLYRLALEKNVSGARYHAIAEDGIPFSEIAKAIGRGLNVPVVSKTPDEAASHFGWFAGFATLDNPVDSERTCKQLGWHPTQVGLIADLDNGSYFTAAKAA